MHDWHSMKSQKAFIKSCVISFMQIVDVVNMQIYANLIYANIVRKDAIMQSRGGKHTIRWNLVFLLDELYYNRIISKYRLEWGSSIILQN